MPLNLFRMTPGGQVGVVHSLASSDANRRKVWLVLSPSRPVHVGRLQVAVALAWVGSKQGKRGNAGRGRVCLPLRSMPDKALGRMLHVVLCFGQANDKSRLGRFAVYALGPRA